MAVSLFLSTILSACAQTQAVLDPYALAPCLPNALYDQETGGSSLISSSYFHTYLPKNYDQEELSLAELIDIALYNNPNTKISWAEARQKAAVYAQSSSAYFPKIDANAIYQRERETFSLSESFTIPYLLTTAGPEINLSYTLLDFGKRKASSESALQGLIFADLSHNRTLQQSIKVVMDDYYNYLFEKERLVASEADLMNAQETLKAAQDKGALGIVARGDIAQAKTAFIQAKIAVIRQKRAASMSFSQLAKNLGLPASICFQVEPLPEKVTTSEVIDDVEDLVERAQNWRPDLQAALVDLAQKRADLSGAEANYAPTVSANFDLGKYWYDHRQDEDYHWTFLFKLDFPLFEGFLRRNIVREKKAAVEKSAAQLLGKELSVIGEVQDAYTDFLSAKESLHFSEEYLLEADIQFAIALESYRTGTNTILDLLSAQSAVADAKAKLAEAKKNWYQALALVAYSTGVLGMPT
ncbi:MAG: TolC family protein [Chlamydiota bacterium]